MLSLLPALALGLVLAAPTAPSLVTLQEPPAVEQASPQPTSPVPGNVAPRPQGVVTGLPQRAPEPRTMAGYWPVFAFFSITWIGFVGYLLVIGMRASRLAGLVQRAGGER